MPPNSTQNLNARLSLTRTGAQRAGVTGIAPPPIQRSAPQIKIVGGASRYSGGYRINV